MKNNKFKIMIEIMHIKVMTNKNHYKDTVYFYICLQYLSKKLFIL